MEQEMKYAIAGKEIADEIWDDEYIKSLSDQSTAEAVVMKAVYFDTADRSLAGNNMTFRVRAEGERYFATLKWGGCVVNGFHERREINVPVTDDIFFINPSIAIFKGSEEGEELINLVGDKVLTNLLETRFLRRRVRITFEGSIIELSLDSGSVITDNGEVPISECELELYFGSVEKVKKLGAILAEKYNLSVKNSSKFADGLQTIKEA